MPKIDKWKHIYFEEDVVMSEILRHKDAKQDLSPNEMRELLAWSGDDEYVYVTDGGEIICKEVT